MMKRLLCLLSAVLFLVVTGMIALGARSVWKDPAPASSPQISTAPKRKQQPASTAAHTWLLSLALREKIAQLIFVPFTGSAPSTRSQEYQRVARLVRDAKVGGLVLVNWTQGRVTQRAEPLALAAFVNRMQKLAQVPLLVSGDFERGASMRVNGVTAFPHAMAFGAADDIDLTRQQGEITAREARALGVHWVFHPVADVNNNPDNPIINIRSFGEDPALVSRHVAAFIQGAQSALSTPVLTSAKHFPGHGDTAVDTHLKLATIPGDEARLSAVELPPFRAAIVAGVDSIMTAHIAVPALAPPHLPATLSSQILTGLLRKRLGFRGIIVTDALQMGGIANGFAVGEAAVRALEAGADLLLMPADPEKAIEAIAAAVKSGRLTAKRIEESAARLLAAKQRVGLHRGRQVRTASVEDAIDTPESNEVSRTVAEKAVALLKNDGRPVPLGDPASTCFVLLAGSARSIQGDTMASAIRDRVRSTFVLKLHPGSSAEVAVRQMSGCNTVVAAAFSQVSAHRSHLAGNYPDLMDALIATGKPTVLVALGNPYLLRLWPNVHAYLATFSTVQASETAAVRALFGEIPIRGKLPVSIPGFAELKQGIQLETRVR